MSNMELTPDQQITQIRSILRGCLWPFNLEDAKKLNFPLEFHWGIGDERCSAPPPFVALPNGILFRKEQILENSIADHATERFRQLQVIKEIFSDQPWPSNSKETSDWGAPLVFTWDVGLDPLSSRPSKVHLMVDKALFFGPEEVGVSYSSAAPPLGLKPRNIHDAQRATDIYQAIGRYVAANKRIPAEWYEELQQLTDGFND